MKTRNILLIGGGLALAYFLLSSTGTAVANRIGVGKIKLSNFSFNLLSGISFTLNIEFINSNPIPLSLDNFTGNIVYGNNPIANVSLSQAFVIGANTTQDLSIDLTAPTANLVGNIVSIIQSGDFLRNLSLIGTGVSNGFSFNVNQPVINI